MVPIPKKGMRCNLHWENTKRTKMPLYCAYPKIDKVYPLYGVYPKRPFICNFYCSYSKRDQIFLILSLPQKCNYAM